MPPQVAPAPGRDRRRPKPRPAPAQGVFVTNAPKEKLPSPEAFASTVALAATGLTLASLIYLQQLKAETIAMMLLLISLFGLLAFVHNARK
jgi:hypothetical protein